MTIDELRKAAQNVGLYLTIPRKGLPKGSSIRMFGRSGPIGKICCVNKTAHGFDVVAHFNGPAVIKYLDDQGRDQ
jgi:hypothetical protein